MPNKEIEICPLCQQIDHIKTIWDLDYQTISFCKNCGYMGDMNLILVYEDEKDYFYQYSDICGLTESKSFLTALPFPLLTQQSPRLQEQQIITKGTLKRIGNKIANRNSIDIKLIRRF